VNRIKKAQAATEFLLTYGWAIIVVLAAIAALSYFGILSPDRFLPNTCILPPGIACLDFNIESSRAILILQNNFGRDINLDAVEVFADTSCVYTDPILIENQAKAVVTITNCTNGLVDQRFDARLNINYTKVGLLTHVMHGNILAKIVAPSTISSFGICFNADSGSLCGGLDVVFGEGYRSACCSEHSLCCP
jgi:hypothetical protein